MINTQNILQKLIIIEGLARLHKPDLIIYYVSNGSSLEQVALFDVNETAAESLMETLQKQHGPGRALYVNCNVESEEQIKGNTHIHTHAHTHTNTHTHGHT